jgi:CBS domain-containing protein
MQSIKVAELMVPLAEYATVHQDATLYEAVLELEKAQREFDQTRYKHRAVLVYDDAQKIVGKLGQLDVLRALEPKYEELQGSEGLARFGFSKKFMKSMLTHYHLWDEPMADICRKACRQTVKRYMHTPTEGEFVEEQAGLGEAIHQLVLGHHQSLLVTRGEQIVGVLRLSDVFAAVFHKMKECQCQLT